MNRLCVIFWLILGATGVSVQAQEAPRYHAWTPAFADTLPPAPPPPTRHDPWIAPDKAQHFAACFLLTLSAQYLLVNKAELREARALPLSAGLALGVGLAKEIADSQRPVHPFFSKRDLVADALGVALGVAVIAL